MSETTHTPGPWVALMEGGGKGGPNSFMIRTAKGRSYDPEPGGSIGRASGRSDGAGRANARLMAAAPDLLEACEAQQRTIDALVKIAERARFDLQHIADGGTQAWARESIARIDSAGAALPEHDAPAAIAKATGGGR